MIGLDTNVLVRYIADDDASQSAIAAKVMESLSSESPGFVPLEKLLRSAELLIENAEIVAQALREFRASRADFADCLIERCAHAAGCQHTVTFDTRAATIGSMQLIQ